MRIVNIVCIIKEVILLLKFWGESQNISNERGMGDWGSGLTSGERN